MFVDLSGVGGSLTNATAPQKEGPPYSVRIRVPRGGIRAIRFGLMGRSCGPAGCRPSPMYFPLVPKTLIPPVTPLPPLNSRLRAIPGCRGTSFRDSLLAAATTVWACFVAPTGR